MKVFSFFEFDDSLGEMDLFLWLWVDYLSSSSIGVCSEVSFSIFLLNFALIRFD